MLYLQLHYLTKLHRKTRISTEANRKSALRHHKLVVSYVEGEHSVFAKYPYDSRTQNNIAIEYVNVLSAVQNVQHFKCDFLSLVGDK
jgi:hypothetical protein